MYKKELNTNQRITALTSLLRDSKELKFNTMLINRYHNQLVSLLVKVAVDKRNQED